MRPLATVAAALLASARPAAQEVPQFAEQERRTDMAVPRGAAGDFFWDWGGWLRSDPFWVDDKPFTDQRSYRFHDLRRWGVVEMGGAWRACGRLYNHWIEYNEGDGFGDDSVWRRVRPDVAFVEGTFSGLGLNGIDATVRAGRPFLTVGRGTLFMDNADGLKLELACRDELSFNAFFARSVRRTRDIDPTVPDPKESRRLFDRPWPPRSWPSS
jgi:hypothetical protein